MTPSGYGQYIDGRNWGPDSGIVTSSPVSHFVLFSLARNVACSPCIYPSLWWGAAEGQQGHAPSTELLYITEVCDLQSFSLVLYAEWLR